MALYHFPENFKFIGNIYKVNSKSMMLVLIFSYNQFLILFLSFFKVICLEVTEKSDQYYQQFIAYSKQTTWNQYWG